MSGLPLSQDLLLMAAQAVAITLVAALVPNRVLLVVVAIAAACVGLALGVPGDFTRTPGALLLDFGGVLAGFALGGAAIALRLRRERGATGRRQAARHAAAPSRGPGVLATGAVVAAIVVLALGAAAWLGLGDAVPEGWRMAARSWVAPAGQGAPAAGATPVSGPTAAPAAGAKGAAAPAAAGADPKPRERARVERPKGDLRHCLQQGSSQDVLRCAEGG
jgi:hypothetical protein